MYIEHAKSPHSVILRAVTFHFYLSDAPIATDFVKMHTAHISLNSVCCIHQKKTHLNDLLI